MSETPKKAVLRSPSYPAMSLRHSVDAIKKIEGVYRSSPVDRTAAAKLIGYSSLSGPANQALSALAAYGLLERAGKGETRVTSRARAILHADNEDERREHLLAAASEPDLFRELTERFQGHSVPPEDGVLNHLNRQGFNPSAVRPATKAFLETMQFVEELRASERNGTKESNEAESELPKEHNRFGGAKVGDLIQWESQGALQFAKPLRVRMVTDDCQWVAVDGSPTGIPMNEVLVDTTAPVGRQTPPIFPFSQEDQAPPSLKGETEWIRNRVGPETNVRLLVTGDMGPKEIGKLIRLLEAQKLVLEED